jgi:hypothetical protein
MKQEIGFERGRRRVSAQSIIPFEQRPTCAAGLGKTKFYELGDVACGLRDRGLGDLAVAEQGAMEIEMVRAISFTA